MTGNRGTIFFLALMLAASLASWSGLAEAASGKMDSSVEFKADRYFRDARTNSISGTGHAWTRKGGKEIYADEIHVDFNTNQAIAVGNVRITDNDLMIWCQQANFNLAGDEATFENATVATGQIVITGALIQKLDAKTLEVDSGTYSNCNVEGADPGQAAECPLDWRISGSRFRIEIGSYAHLYDVLVQAKSVPVFYVPYLLLPMKTGRQTGVLPISLNAGSALGTGFSIPVFFALSEWQDLLATYTQFSTAGMHLGMRYRYIFSPMSRGSANVYLLSQRFGTDDAPLSERPNSPKTLGLGEGAISVHNVYTFTNGRTQSRQMLNLVSNPFYSYNYLGDLPARADLGYLRNQLTLSHPTDHWLLAGNIQYFQPLTISDDYGVDRGSVLQLPTLTAAKTTSNLGSDLLAYEFDAQFTNYHRKIAFDDVPENPASAGPQVDNIDGFDSNDYLRTGRRLQMEPRLILNTPMPNGFLLQPVLKAGTLVYHFSTPRSEVLSRYYLQTEIPFSFQVQKSFSTSSEDFERVQHVFQPRVIFASDLYSNPTTQHPFFRRSSATIINPPFDEKDLLPHYQYFRFELINRFRARSHGSWRRFFLLQMSEQFNNRTDSTDPRFKDRLGPIELLGALNVGRIGWSVQAMYPLELTRTLNGLPLPTPVRQVTISTALEYNSPGSDHVRLNVSMYKNADPALSNHTLFMHWYKTLPLFFDVEATLEYNLLKGKIRSYGAGFHFRRKPRSCWHLSLNLSRNIFGQTFTQFGFGFDFGSY